MTIPSRLQSFRLAEHDLSNNPKTSSLKLQLIFFFFLIPKLLLALLTLRKPKSHDRQHCTVSIQQQGLTLINIPSQARRPSSHTQKAFLPIVEKPDPCDPRVVRCGLRSNHALHTSSSSRCRTTPSIAP